METPLATAVTVQGPYSGGMSSMSSDRSVAAGDPIGYAAQQKAEEELLRAAEAVLDWLYDRRAHLPEELLDHREARYRKALCEAIRKARWS
jgi:hypothetical protein